MSEGKGEKEGKRVRRSLCIKLHDQRFMAEVVPQLLSCLQAEREREQLVHDERPDMNEAGSVSAARFQRKRGEERGKE